MVKSYASPALACASVLALSPAIAGAEPRAASSQPTFVPSPELDLPALEALVKQRSTDATQADLAVDLARSDVRQAGILPNLVFDFTWGTIPVGPTNPEHIDDPLGNIPLYSFGLSYTIPLGKVGPREASAEATLHATEASRDGIVRQQAIELLRALGAVATSELRIEGLQSIAADALQDRDTAAVRLKAGFGTEIDVERLETERTRADQAVFSARSDEASALARCSGIVGQTCAGFPDAATAEAFLDHWIDREPAQPFRFDEREDVVAIDASREAAKEDRTFAHNQAIPDPTVRLGYTHDRFIISGDQRNSLSVTLTLPITAFDHGQAMADAASAKTERLLELRNRSLDEANARVPALLATLRSQRERRASLETDALPRAKEVVDELGKSLSSSLVPVDQIISAHRVLSELEVERADAYGDAFAAATDLAAELPPHTTWTPVAAPAPAPSADPRPAPSAPPTETKP